MIACSIKIRSYVVIHISAWHLPPYLYTLYCHIHQFIHHFLLLFYCAYVADIQWLSVSVINYYNCTISGKWNEVTLLSLLSIGLLVGELGNNWGSKCGCFFILLPSSLSWALLLNSFRIIGCNLLGDSSCMLATGPLVASSSPVGAMVMCVGMVLWRRSRVVGLNTRKQLCSVWWSLRLGFPIRTSKKMKVYFIQMNIHFEFICLTCYWYRPSIGWDTFHSGMGRGRNLGSGWKANHWTSHNRLKV